MEEEEPIGNAQGGHRHGCANDGWGMQFTALEIRLWIARTCKSPRESECQYPGQNETDDRKAERDSRADHLQQRCRSSCNDSNDAGESADLSVGCHQTIWSDEHQAEEGERVDPSHDRNHQCGSREREHHDRESSPARHPVEERSDEASKDQEWREAEREKGEHSPPGRIRTHGQKHRVRERYGKCRFAGDGPCMHALQARERTCGRKTGVRPDYDVSFSYL